MIQGTYYKEWSRMLGRDMEFKVYGHAGTPVLALPARGGRFYDWENNGMPDAIAPLLNEGKVQLFCADSIDAESLLAGDTAPRRRAEMQEKYFNYLTSELAPRILTLNGAKKDTLLWAVGVDTGAYQAVNCRLRRPEVFADAIGLSGLYDVRRFLGNAADDLVLRNAPLAYLAEDGLVDKKLLAKAEENALLLCAGQGSYEGDALVDGNSIISAPEKVRRCLTYLPDEAGAYKNMKGRQYLRFMADMYADNKQQSAEFVKRAEEICRLGERLDDKVESYSRGMIRKLLLARTIMSRPELAILDEPTSGLDIINALDIRRMIRSLAEQGMSFLLSSHNMLEIEYVSDRVGIIAKGNLLEVGTPAELLEKYGAENLEEVFERVVSSR